MRSSVLLRVSFEPGFALEQGGERGASVVSEPLMGESGEDEERGGKKPGRSGVLPEGDLNSKAKSQQRTR